MRWSSLFIPTLRDNPAQIDDVGHQLLLRAGYLRQVTPGVYAHLFLAERSLGKILRIVSEEMDTLGAQELRLPVLHSSASVVAGIAEGELRSYRQLPQIWHHIHTTVDEQRHSRPDLLRARQSLASESFSFDVDSAGRDLSYQKHRDAYSRIFERCALKCFAADSDSGAIVVATSDAGDTLVVRCQSCGYAAGLESASTRAAGPPISDPDGDHTPEPFHTPGRKTIADVAAFTGLPETSQMKSLALVADGLAVLALVRGDHSLNESKFARAISAVEFRPAHAAEILSWFGAEAGSLGPVGVKNMRILADQALHGRRNMIAGANKDDYHLRYVTPGKDFTPEYFDLRQVVPGDECLRCGGALDFLKCIEIAQLMKLDRPHSDALNMGCYTIQLDRLFSTVIEQHHDADGMVLPAAIAPFDVVITPVSVADAALRSASEEIYESCRKMDLDTLFDDRDERPGVKFKDADLIGIPYRITIGKKLAEGTVEIVERRTKKREDVDKEYAAAFIAGGFVGRNARP